MVIIFCAEIQNTQSSAPLLKQVLTGPCGLPQEVRIGRTPEGKPFADVETDLSFSVSHTGSLWICAVGQQPLGVDVEYEDRSVNNPERLARRFFSVHEQKVLQEGGFSPRMFLELWTRKEAFLKLQGTGLLHTPPAADRLDPGGVFYCEDPLTARALAQQAGRPVVFSLCSTRPVSEVQVIPQQQWRRD